MKISIEISAPCFIIPRKYELSASEEEEEERPHLLSSISNNTYSAIILVEIVL